MYHLGIAVAALHNLQEVNLLSSWGCCVDGGEQYLISACVRASRLTFCDVAYRGAFCFRCLLRQHLYSA